MFLIFAASLAVLFSADYCAAFCTPSVAQSSYLHTVGDKLLPGVDILWTGEVTLNHSSTTSHSFMSFIVSIIS